MFGPLKRKRDMINHMTTMKRVHLKGKRAPLTSIITSNPAKRNGGRGKRESDIIIYLYISSKHRPSEKLIKKTPHTNT
jgi:hypothetical protein